MRALSSHAARLPAPPTHRLRAAVPEPLRRTAGALCATAVTLLALAIATPPARAAAAFPAFGRHGMVVTSQVDATRAGHAMLASGGNAVDAAVAAAFAVGVTQPFSTGIGGGGFILLRLAPDPADSDANPDGTVIAIDARETAPAGATREMYVMPGVDEKASVHGPLAVATPGLVAGLAMVQQRYGTKSLADVMAPAIRLASEGFAIGAYHARMIEYMRKRFPAERFPETARIQFPPPGVKAEPGWRLVQKDLGRTLEKIAKEGPDAFYRGPIAKAIAAQLAVQGGLVTAADLASYVAKQREPVTGTYRGIGVYSYPPPSSGGVILLEMLNILEGFELKALGSGSSKSLHTIGEAMKLAFADRAAYLGDPDFVEVPVERLISKPYADEQRARIADKAIRVEAPGQPVDDSGTTHLSTSDRTGNAVAITKTINTPYGSGITVAGTGIVLNNEMDDFSKAIDAPNAYGLVDTRGANAIAPGKRPLSSMTPTILLRDGKLFMATGSPGGPRIITTTLLSILNVVDYGMDVQGAVAAPRFHHQWVPDKLFVEPATTRDVIENLRAMGHEVLVSRRNWSAAEAIVIDPETGWHLGGSDPRRDGLALGYSAAPADATE